MNTATITEYGATVTDYPVGTVLSFDEAKELPSGKPDEGLFVATWSVSPSKPVDSVPVKNSVLVDTNFRLHSSLCLDNQLDINQPFRNHTRPAPQTSDLRNELTKSIDDLELPCNQKHKLRLKNWRQPVFDSIKKHGDFAPSMVRAFTNIMERKDYFTALQMIQDADKRLREDGIRFARNDEEITELAKAKSQAFSKELWKIDDVNKRFEKAESLLKTLGLSFRPALVKEKQKNNELDSLCKRAICDKWLRRQLRRLYFTRVENVARDLMLVHKSQDAYCSKHSVSVMQQRNAETDKALVNTVCYLEDNEDTWFTLKELAAKSTANPIIRRAEMFVRLRAFEDIAKESGHVAMFYTVTTPSRFHVYKGNDLNPKWVKAGKPTALQAHEHLKSVSDAFRKELDNNEIKLYGLRIVEPHHDGTPHNHMLFFVRPEHKDFVTECLRKHALSDSPKEAGAAKFRFKSEAIDWNKGSAVGYIAKYLSKNIDGANIDSDKDTKLDGEETSASVVAFNRIRGIRQFQFYGGPSVTTWREMRRFREEFKETDAMILGNQLSQDEHFVLESIRKAADEGDFKRFIMAMGGVFVKRNQQELRIDYVKKINVEGLFKQTRYGDEMSAAINGILFRGHTLKTRFKDWKFASKKQFIRGIRSVMTGTKMVFNSLEDEAEYYTMKQEEYERMCDESAFFLDMPSVDPSIMYDEEVYSLLEPADMCPSWAQPDWDTYSGALDSCH
ncbi:replication endonuclease [Vibrio genomosp. F6]|uniref:Replication initiation protein n=1 Tax=Vibrio genomosp. F6 str. FF-238 TaxID=1191298 RepID=A0A1E5CLD2_9VIBR|nr:replication endonuclease [Vibrio genomosp. F6]OEE69473.1 replication initiation protein [Vibrio genomosp. F6 str. FF-238]